jgi:phosphoesterase RecJ-like protein
MSNLTPEQKIIGLEIKKLIDGATSILMHCHPNPDPDSLGSTLGLKFALESLGKKVTIIGGDSKTPDAFMHFPGAKDILQQTYGETDLSQYDLFLILDCGSIEMISKKSEVVFPSTLKTAVIDHHASNKGYADVNLVAIQYPSTTAIVFDLIKDWGIPLTHDIAANLYVGLFTDTGGFRYDLVTNHSFAMAAELYTYAPDMIRIVKELENTATRGNIEFLALGLGNKQVFDFANKTKGQYAITTISYDEIQKLGLTEDDYWNASFVTNLLRSVVGWNVVCILTEQKPGIVKASFRTRDHIQFDVSKLALHLGGGGHKAASGATFNTSLPSALEAVRKGIEEVF